MCQIIQLGVRLDMYLTIKTSDEIAEICLYNEHELEKEKKWDAGYELSETILTEIDNILGSDFDLLFGIVVFVGPGSFTGLRIGISVANALAYGKNISIVGEGGNDWINNGIDRLMSGENDKIVTPKYGGEANITQPH